MKKVIVMAGTGLGTMGGISAVVKVYRAAGLFERYPLVYLATHCDGGALAKLGAMARAYARYLALMGSGRVGLLHVHVASRASFWRKLPLFALAYACRVPAVLHLHGGGFAVFYERDCGPVRRWLIRAVFDRAARVLVLSAGWRAWVQSISSNRRVDTLFNPVVMPPAVADWAARTPQTILFLGKLGQPKGVYDLLDAVRELRADFPAMRVLLGGDGEAAQVQARIDALGLGQQVRLLGWVQSERKQQLLDTSAIYVLPSYFEGLPMSILEAMAAGLPVVATPVGGIPEAVGDGVEGYLVAPGDVAGLAASLRRLMADPALAMAMGAAGRARVAGAFSTDAVLPRVEQLYNELGFAAR